MNFPPRERQQLSLRAKELRALRGAGVAEIHAEVNSNVTVRQIRDDLYALRDLALVDLKGRARGLVGQSGKEIRSGSIRLDRNP